MKGQLYICGENVGNGTDKYVTIILVTGVIRGGPEKGKLHVKLVASGSNISLSGVLYMQGIRNDLPLASYYLPADYLTRQPIYSSRWSGNDRWYPISVPDLLRWINLPKKSILFDKIISGEYKRI